MKELYQAKQHRGGLGATYRRSGIYLLRGGNLQKWLQEVLMEKGENITSWETSTILANYRGKCSYF